LTILNFKIQDHPSILLSKVRSDFTRIGRLTGERLWMNLRLRDFYIDHINHSGRMIRVIKMIPKSELSPDVQISLPTDIFAIYETGTELCPVASFEYYLSRIDYDVRESKTTMFLLDDKACSENNTFWFTKKALPQSRRKEYFTILEDIIRAFLQFGV